VALQLVADRRPDEVGAIGVDAVVDQEINLPEIDDAQVDRNLLALESHP
jgi:hypothetical protein